MADFISKLQINAFRGVKDLALDNLSTVNVLVGANNCGKTSVLEAISFLACPYYISRIAALASMRHIFSYVPVNQSIADDISTLFFKERNQASLKLHCREHPSRPLRFGNKTFPNHNDSQEVNDLNLQKHFALDFYRKYLKDFGRWDHILCYEFRIRY